VVFRGGECERGRSAEITDAAAKRIDFSLGARVIGHLSVTSIFHSFPVPLVIFKRFQNILFGLLG